MRLSQTIEVRTGRKLSKTLNIKMERKGSS
jgi:hypothetical protein